MIHLKKVLQSPSYDSYRANRIRSMFNVTVEQGNSHTIDIKLPIDQKNWQIGLVVGGSGTGKTTVGKMILGDRSYHKGFAWDENKPIVEDIGGKEFKQATGALSSVGLGSVPSWLRPYQVLSTGEKFRADLARIIIEQPEKIVVDEFTSVVDRQVAQVGAAAFAKSWRKTKGKQIVLLSCHYDIVEWLCPDWILETNEWKFTWGSLRQRPQINLQIFTTQKGKFWKLFKRHHYLDLALPIAAYYYIGLVDNTPVAHLAVSTSPGLKSARFARLVVKPEWQGIGIGMKFINYIAEQWLEGNNPYKKKMTSIIRTSHPGLIIGLKRSPLWVALSQNIGGTNKKKSRQGLLKAKAKTKSFQGAGAGYGGHLRATAGFRYVGVRSK